jgi:hypothetical protein
MPARMLLIRTLLKRCTMIGYTFTSKLMTVEIRKLWFPAAGRLIGRS